ncbi:hypothetical protein BDF19DRAFT_213636 [Syncephalis fuscata]|nr:hypothetical protein BDF19DRAFT_213636 [Syncephalis fuscata]
MGTCTKVIQEDIRAKTAYMCARLWSGDCATAEEFLYTEFFQTDLSSFTPEKRVEYANMSQQLIRALSWEYADQYNFKATARIELRRQYWIQRYSHLDGLGSWDNNEPTIVMLHYYCSLFRHMLTKTVLSKREFQNNEMRFNQLLEDTRRNAKFQRELEFYNIFLRCQNALSQLRERLGIFPDYLNADKILREMKSDGVTPNRFTYHLLMEGIVYSQIPFPENFDRAMSIAQRMDVAGVDQRVSRTYELLIRTFPLSNHAYQHSSNFIKHNSSPLLNTSTTTTNANDSSLPTERRVWRVYCRLNRLCLVIMNLLILRPPCVHSGID